MKKLLSALLLGLLVSPSAYSADAPMGPNNLRIDVQVEQTQGTSSRMRSSAGDFSKTDTNRRNLLVRLRRIGSCDPEVNVYAFFVARATSGRISGFYGAGMQSANVKPADGTLVEFESNDLSANRDRIFDFKFVSGDYPHGWVVLVYQKGRKVKETGSTPEMLTWFWKNLSKSDAGRLR